jgi:hypothetical protein
LKNTFCGFITFLEEIRVLMDRLDAPIIQKVYEGKLVLNTPIGFFYILGEIPLILNQLIVYLQFGAVNSKKQYRKAINLFDSSEVEKFAYIIAKSEDYEQEDIEFWLDYLITELEKHREQIYIQEKNLNNVEGWQATNKIDNTTLDILKSTTLFETINRALTKKINYESAEISIALFIVASSYISNNPMYLVLFEQSNEIAQKIISDLLNFIPKKQQMNLDSISLKSLLYVNTKEFHRKCVTITESNRLNNSIRYEFLNFQKTKKINCLKVAKTKSLNFNAFIETKSATFSSLIGSNQPLLNEELFIQSRYNPSILNNSIDINENNNDFYDYKLVHDILSGLKTHNVFNPFSGMLKFPDSKTFTPTKVLFFWKFCNQITCINQYQRKFENGLLKSEKEDILFALNLLFKVHFFTDNIVFASIQEKLYYQIMKAASLTNNQFSAMDFIELTKLSKTHSFRHIKYFLENNWVSKKTDIKSNAHCYIIIKNDVDNNTSHLNSLIKQVESLNI